MRLAFADVTELLAESPIPPATAFYRGRRKRLLLARLKSEPKSTFFYLLFWPLELPSVKRYTSFVG